MRKEIRGSGREASVLRGCCQSLLFAFCGRDAWSGAKLTLQATHTSALGCKFESQKLCQKGKMLVCECVTVYVSLCVNCLVLDSFKGLFALPILRKIGCANFKKENGSFCKRYD